MERREKKWFDAVAATRLYGMFYVCIQLSGKNGLASRESAPDNKKNKNENNSK